MLIIDTLKIVYTNLHLGGGVPLHRIIDMDKTLFEPVNWIKKLTIQG